MTLPDLRAARDEARQKVVNQVGAIRTGRLIPHEWFMDNLDALLRLQSHVTTRENSEAVEKHIWNCDDEDAWLVSADDAAAFLRTLSENAE